MVAGVDLNHRPLGYEPTNTSNFNNLQDAGGPQKTLRVALRNRYWTVKGQRTITPLALKLLKSPSSRGRGSLIPAPLAPAESSRVESFSATRRCALPQIENCFRVRLQAKVS